MESVIIMRFLTVRARQTAGQPPRDGALPRKRRRSLSVNDYQRLIHATR